MQTESRYDSEDNPVLCEIRPYADTFQTSQSDLKQHNGKTFTVLRSLTKEEVDIDEVGMMYEIQLVTGEVIHAFEDEII